MIHHWPVGAGVAVRSVGVVSVRCEDFVAMVEAHGRIAPRTGTAGGEGRGEGSN